MLTFFKSHMDDIKDIYSNLLDDESKNIFINRLLYNLTNDKKYSLNMMNIEPIVGKIDKFQRAGKKILIFGAGYYGRYIVEKTLGQLNFECFIDNNIRDAKVLNLRVIDFNEFKNKYFNEIVVVSPTGKNEEIYTQLIQSGFNKENIINLGEYIKDYNDKCLPIQYFEFFNGNDEQQSFVDAGCLDGYTSKRFFECCKGRYSNIWAFEPDTTSYEICKKELNLPDCTVYDLGLYDKDGTISFKSGLNAGSTIDLEGETTIKIAKLDNLLKGEKITFIKMDIEGAELNALIGAENIIRTQKPNLAICVYHKPEDIISIPKLLLDYNPNYKFRLRHYTTFWGDTVLYAFNQEEE